MQYNEITDTERYHAAHEPTDFQRYAADVRFSNAQLQYIRYGLDYGLDVSVYANPEIPVHIMKELWQALRFGPKQFVIRHQVNDKTEMYHITCNSKQEALELFSMHHDVESIIDIRTPEECC